MDETSVVESPPTALVQHISKTIAGRTFVKPLAQAMTPDTRYTTASMGQLLGKGWSAKKVTSKHCVLGRPEKRFHAKIFQRPADGEFLITAEMKAALMAAVYAIDGWIDENNTFRTTKGSLTIVLQAWLLVRKQSEPWQRGPVASWLARSSRKTTRPSLPPE